MYALAVERIERDVAVAQQAAVLAAAFGGQAELPDLGRALVEFDEWLNSEPKSLTAADQEQVELRQVLGLVS